MDAYFDYIDGVVFMLAVLAAFFLTYNFKKQAAAGIRVVPLFFASFGASLVVSSMAAGHLFENIYRAAVRMFSGTFVFDFHFYSIILMGGMILTFGIYMLWQLQSFIRGNPIARKRFVMAALILSAVTMPVFLFRPIGILPTVACAIAISGIAFVHKRVKVAEMQATRG